MSNFNRGKNHHSWKGGKITKKCLTCNKEFLSYASARRTYCSPKCLHLALLGTKHSDETKRKMSLSAKKGAEHPFWKGGEIAEKCLFCGKTFHIHFYRKDTAQFCSMKCRAKYDAQDFKNENHPNWKGDNAKYSAIHTWLRKNHTKTGICNFCHKKFERTDWALKRDKQYSRNINDYFELCRSCHKKYDATSKRKLKISNSLKKYHIDKSLMSKSFQ